MNISNISGKDSAIPDVDFKDARENATKNPSCELAKITDTANLSSLIPSLQGIMDAIYHPGGNVIEGINDNIGRLQDTFVESLYGLALATGVDLNQKLTLRLDENNALLVIGEHPDKENMETALGSRPDISTAFKEISTLSELLRNVRNIDKIIGVSSGAAAYENMQPREVQARYQFSLKGDMSHFYFTTP